IPLQPFKLAPQCWQCVQTVIHRSSSVFGHDNGDSSTNQRRPQQRRSHDPVDGRSRLVGIDGDHRPISDNESRISSADSMCSIGVETLSFDAAGSEIFGKSAAQLYLKGSATPAEIRAGRKAVAGIER